MTSVILILCGLVVLGVVLAITEFARLRPRCPSTSFDRRCDLDQAHADQWHRSFHPTVCVWKDGGDRGFEVIQGGKRGAA